VPEIAICGVCICEELFSERSCLPLYAPLIQMEEKIVAHVFRVGVEFAGGAEERKCLDKWLRRACVF